MIIYKQAKPAQRLLLTVVTGAIVAGGVWMLMKPDAPPSGRAADASPSAEAGPSGTAAPFGTAADTVAVDGRPVHVQPDDWKALNASLRRQPDPQAEAQRIASYLRYQHDFEFWQSTIDSKNVRARHQLAEQLMAQLPERVAKGEFTGMEAVLMGTVLLGDLEPDEARRQQRIDEWTQKLATAAPQPTDERQLADKDRNTAYMRKRAVAFLEWQALPAGERSQDKLDKGMDDAQRWYASGAEDE
ncbi:hypothetical protein DEH84_05130 [Aquabacterium olei]|uniref:Lipase chaperone n=1 Tax=Aquabacterium olei TaxID=1296669 RepID=A0A2U8FPD8_9BURK|nr:hypothetical protein [Aquabacterium olei]AWI52873.1 hypothetical protein DEH84_05130 [Aquabacterium olei]